MLDGVATFVRSDGGSSYRTPFIHFRREVDRFVGGVVVVGQFAWNRRDAHSAQAVVVQHGARYFCAGHAAVQELLAVFLKSVLEASLDCEAQTHKNEEDDDEHRSV